MSEAEVDRLRECVRRDRPLGGDAWTRATAERLGLESSLRPPGRPRTERVGAAATT
jgi:putative transposase